METPTIKELDQKAVKAGAVKRGASLYPKRWGTQKPEVFCFYWFDNNDTEVMAYIPDMGIHNKLELRPRKWGKEFIDRLVFWESLV